jgi:hypothetical protein
VKTTQRQYTSDASAYETFVGSVTPEDFVKGYEEFDCPVDEAVKDYLRQFPFEEEIPDWLEDALYRYVSTALG